MPVIQRIEAQRGLGGAPRPSVQVDQGIARGLSQVGNALEGAASAEQQMALRLERQNMQIQEFKTDQQFRQFQQGLGTQLAEAQQNMDPSGANLTENFVKSFDEKSSEFLTSVPESLKPKFAELVETSRAGWLDKVALTERDQRYSWYRTGITESQEKLQSQVFNDPALYEAAKEDGYRAIETSGLPAAEKEELRKQWEDTLSVTVAEREIRNVEQSPGEFAGAAMRLGVPGATLNGGDAASLLREFEGFRETPYWDVNANRVGYGSDTVTRADGTVERVTEDTRVTRADAERDLARRAKEFERGAIEQVGVDQWAALPPNAQAALVSVAYNYGELPKSVEGAVRGGNIQAIASAVEGLAGHNDGVNAKRRRREAAIIRGGDIAQNAPDLMDERYANLSLSQRLEIYDRMAAAEQRGVAAIEAQRNAIQTATYDSLTLGIQTGDVVSEQTILNNNSIDDGQKATLIKALHTKMDETAGVNELISAITSEGGSVSINPFDSNQTKVAESALTQMLKSTPEENKQAVTRSFIEETGYIPKSEVAVIRQASMSTDYNDFTNAMVRARNLRNAAPEHFASVDGFSNVRRDLERFDAYTQTMGYSAEDAARRILQSRTAEGQVNEELLGAQADKILKEVDASSVANLFDPGVFSAGPGAGADVTTQNMLVSDYRQAFRERYLQVGDEDEARALAAADLKKTWGVSETSGSKQLMKFPPEMFYPAVSGGHDYLRTDAVETATEIGGAEPSNVYLRPWIDPATGRNLTAEDVRAGRLPRYRLIYEREENGQRIIDMAPSTWAVPQDQVDTLSEQARAQAMQDARASRQWQEENVAPVANEVFPLTQNMLEGRQSPAVEGARNAVRGGAQMGTMLERIEVSGGLAPAQGVEGVADSVREQGQQIRERGVR